MINLIVDRLLKRAGLTPEKLQELVQQTTKEQKEISDLYCESLKIRDLVG